MEGKNAVYFAKARYAFGAMYFAKWRDVLFLL